MIKTAVYAYNIETTGGKYGVFEVQIPIAIISDDKELCMSKVCDWGVVHGPW